MKWLFQGILSDVLKCLGDNKKHMRECTLATLDSWLSAVHLDKMVTFYCFVWKGYVPLSDALTVLFL